MMLSDQTVGELKNMHRRAVAESALALSKLYNATSTAGKKRWRDEYDLKCSDATTLAVVLAFNGVTAT